MAFSNLSTLESVFELMRLRCAFSSSSCGRRPKRIKKFAFPSVRVYNRLRVDGASSAHIQHFAAEVGGVIYDHFASLTNYYKVKHDRPGECSPEKDCLRWHWLTFRQPERKSSSESSDLGNVGRYYKNSGRRCNWSTYSWCYWSTVSWA